MPRIAVLTLFIFLILRGECALECGDGQYLEEDACRECKSTCGKCISEFLCTKCVDGFFGETCTKTCHEGCHAKLCDKETGACLSCKKGYYQTETCEQCPENCTECHNADTCTNCKTGYTGNTCQKLCVNCQPDSACSLETGICNDGCKDEYSGYSCLEHCNSNCLSCNRIDAKKCLTCAKGKYGSNCERPCPSKCIDNSCNKDTGSCLLGCLNGTLCSPHLETDYDKSYVIIVAAVVVGAAILVSVICVTVCIKRRKARLSGRTQSRAEGCSKDDSEMCNLRYPVSQEENELLSNMGKQYGDQNEEESGHECESLLETSHDPSKMSASGSVPETVLQKLYEGYRKKGVQGLTENVRDSLNEWKKIPLAIAVTGNSGTGKSSFINAIRGLKPADKGAAKVGVTETTTTPTAYRHPDNESLKLWDLPGVGTPKFPKDTYLKKVQFDRFDFFIIITCGRFTENDLWLARQVQILHKKCYFIRTKIDIEVNNDKQDYPHEYSGTVVLDKMQKEIADQLRAAGFEEPKIFLINNRNQEDFDFGTLSASLIQESPDLKREAFALSLTNLSEEVIREKSKVLQKRIYIVSLASAAAGAVPIPGVGESVDAVILLEEALLYRKQLGLEEETLRKYAATLGVTVENLTVSLNLNIRMITFTTKGLLAFFAILSFSNVAENALSIVLPIIGSAIASALSYGTQVHCLKSLLKALEEDAVKIHRKLASTVILKQENL